MRGNFYTQTKTNRLMPTQFAYGLLMAVETAKQYGFDSIAVAEFGVANGRGLRIMVDMAERLSKQSGVDIQVYGFDTGSGLTAPKDYRDNPHMFSQGGYAMANTESLQAELSGKAELIIGDIGDIKQLSDVIDPDIPFGFASVDVDLYSSTMATFDLLATAGPDSLLPVVNLYVHDSFGRQHYHRFVAQLLAIDDFNQANTSRKIDIDRFIGWWFGKTEPWHASMYAMHSIEYNGRKTTWDKFNPA
jgi:hypothetical protein